MEYSNTYEDQKRAESYAKLEFPGTYYLAYRNLPEIISSHVNGKKAMDFGCGTGRSTRFLRKLRFDTIGVDIAEDMIKKAKELDASGKYFLIHDGNLNQFANNSFDLVLSAFTFDNIPTMEKKVELLTKLGRLLNSNGKIINLVSSPDIYINEWASFSTKNFPENRNAKSGDKVKIIMTDVEDQRPVEDIVWTDEYYHRSYQKAGLEIVDTFKPLAKDNEPFNWINETKIAPWIVYVLKKAEN